eukprot:COSAG02_NODE_7903_length_2798_cov_2.115969_1_plen_99_part_00
MDLLTPSEPLGRRYLKQRVVNITGTIGTLAVVDITGSGATHFVVSLCGEQSGALELATVVSRVGTIVVQVAATQLLSFHSFFVALVLLYNPPCGRPSW